MMANKEIDTSNYTGVAFDSRQVEHGNIFVSIEGTKANGDDFIKDAIQNGATLIITSEDSNYQAAQGTAVIKVKHPRKTLAKLANQFYQPQPENIVAVTGTSGKTSVAYFYQQITELLGCKSASIGTLGIKSNVAAPIELEGSLTSPDPVTLNRSLELLATAGVTHVAIEASSHGIEQKRLSGIKFCAAAFTNFSQDHLDYHQTMDQYFKAKMQLFTKVLHSGYAIINADISEFADISQLISSKSSLKILTYGHLGNQIKLISKKKNIITLEILGSNFTTTFYPEGNFQIHNLMAAIGLAIANNFKPHEIMTIVPQLKAAPGRMEKVATYNDAKIFVDYSHKPDALEKALQTLKNECEGQLFVIFGCGGDRDKTKRPIMGAIAGKYADYVIITDDNPRFEDASQIRSQVMAGCPNAQEYANRSTAIAQTIAKLKPQDILLIAGKGHETYQIIGNDHHHFSDTEEVLRALNPSKT